MTRWAALLLAFAMLFGVVAPAWASDKNPFLVEIGDAKLAPGEQGKVTVTLVVPQDHHVYRDMMHISVVDAGKLTVGEPSFPPGRQLPDPANAAQTREMYDLDVVIELPVTAPAEPGTYDLELEVAYQGCRKTLCWLPQREDHTAHVNVAGGGASTATDKGTATNDLPFAVKAGAQKPGVAVIDVEVKAPWHVNRDFLLVRLDEGSPYTLGELDAPPGTKWENKELGISRMDLTEDFTLSVPVSGPDGKVDLPVIVMLQACKDTLCKMPEDVPVVVPVEVGSGGIATAAILPPPVRRDASADGGSFSPGDAFSQARTTGLGALLGLVFMAGIGVSLTPCVLPMVPITIGIIGARSAGSRVQAIALSATYVLGLALVYSGLGIAAGFTGMMFGAWMQSPWVVGAISLFFFVMGGAMFGLFDVGLPSALQSKLASVGGSGFGGAFVIGMVGALVAGPCSGPVLLSIIALIGQKGEVALGALLMLVFSVGMGLIFIVAGAFSTTLLRPGAWMDTVKKSFGLVMWAGAVYFASPHLSETVTALVAGGMLLVTATFAWPADEESEGFWIARSRKLYSLVGVLVGGYLLMGVLITKGFILPPLQAGSVGASNVATAGIAWSTDEAAAMERAKKEGRPLLIDFTADWCAACKELEHFTYTNPDVIAASTQMVPVMIDATNDKDPKVKALLEKYEVRGLPTVKFLEPDGSTLHELTVTGFVPAEDFLPRMKTALDQIEG